MLGEAAGPCAGCRHYDRCTAQKICCEAFLVYARHGEFCSPVRWATAPRQPNADAMRRLQAKCAAGDLGAATGSPSGPIPQHRDGESADRRCPLGLVIDPFEVNFL
jgi:hypothetical protein